MLPEPAFPSRAYRGQSTPRDRAVAAILSFAMLALFALVIISMGWVNLRPDKLVERLTSITMPAAGSSSKGEQKAKQKPTPVKPLETNPNLPPMVPPKLVIPNPTAPPAAPVPAANNDLASFDLAKLGKGGSGNSRGNSSATYGPGEGPQGQTLYKAEWYREPTSAELSGYMTEQSAGAKWAEIACRTIENYHVDNCQSLGESPPGSGLARSLRQAAWQFRVIPPRIDGKAQVGAWVRIHFDFVRGEAR